MYTTLEMGGGRWTYFLLDKDENKIPLPSFALAVLGDVCTDLAIGTRHLHWST